MEQLSCDMLLQIAEKIDPIDYINFSQVSKKIQRCLDTGRFQSSDIERVKNMLADVRRQYDIYHLPSEYQKGKQYNIVNLYKSVEFGLNTRKEFETFIRKMLPSDIIINDEGANVIDYVYDVEDALGSYDPLNNGDVIIVFDYDRKTVRWAWWSEYTDKTMLLWSK